LPLTAIIASRRPALINHWRANPLVLVQVEAPGALPDLVFLDDNGERADVGRFGRRSA
jgi:hypothetical protein